MLNKEDTLDVLAALEHVEAALAYTSAMQKRHFNDKTAPLHIFGVNAELVRAGLMLRGLRDFLRAEAAEMPMSALAKKEAAP